MKKTMLFIFLAAILNPLSSHAELDTLKIEVRDQKPKAMETLEVRIQVESDAYEGKLEIDGDCIGPEDSAAPQTFTVSFDRQSREQAILVKAKAFNFTSTESFCALRIRYLFDTPPAPELNAIENAQAFYVMPAYSQSLERACALYRTWRDDFKRGTSSAKGFARDTHERVRREAESMLATWTGPHSLDDTCSNRPDEGTAAAWRAEIAYWNQLSQQQSVSLTP